MKLLNFYYLKKYKIQIPAILIAIIVLSIAFATGGSLDENNLNFDNNIKSSIPISTKDEIAKNDTSSLNNNSIQNNSTSPIATEFETKNISNEKNKTEATTVSSNPDSSLKVSEPNIKNSDTSKTQTSQSNSIPVFSTAPTQERTEKDKYLTDPVPSGKPEPVEPDTKVITDNKLKCTFSISCSTILDNIEDLDEEKIELVPSDGWILKPISVTFKEGESVFDVLQRVCKDNKIHMESSFTPMYNSAYIEGINNLYEFDCGSLSGWMYSVNDWFPNYGCSRYQLKDGDIVEWKYTCDLGYDVGGGYATGG